MKKILKFVLFAFLTGGVILLGTIFSLPFWLSSVLNQFSGIAGVEWENIERTDWERFQILGITRDRDGVDLRIEKVEARFPHTWVLAALRGENLRDTDPFLIIKEAVLVIDTDRDEPEEERDPLSFSPYTVAQDLIQYWKMAAFWAPILELSQVRVQFGEDEVLVDSVIWERGVLTGKGSFRDYPITLKIATRQETFLGGKIKLPTEQIELTFGIETLEDSLDLNTTILWRDNNPIEANASFGIGKKLLPERAQFLISDLRIPEDMLPDVGYDNIRLNFDAKWIEDSFRAQSRIAILPTILEDGTALPGLNLKLSLAGDPQSILLEEWILESEVLRADLESPVSIATNLQETFTSQLTLSGDLSKQPFLPLKGDLEGLLDLISLPNEFPQASFEFSVAGFQWEDLPKVNLAIRLAFEYPTITVDSFELSLQNGSQINLEGQYDLESAIFGLIASFDLQSDDLAVLIDEPFEWQSFEGQLIAEGKWPEIAHQLEVSWQGVEYGDEMPTGSISGQLYSIGNGLTLNSWGLTLEAEEFLEEIVAEGQGGWVGDRFSLQFDNLNISWHLELPDWSLAGEYALIEYLLPENLNTTLMNIGWQASEMRRHLEGPEGMIAVTGLVLQEEAGELLSLNAQVHFPQQGEAELKIGKLDLAPIIDHAVVINYLALHARWNDSPLELNLDSEFSYALDGIENENSKIHTGIRVTAQEKHWTLDSLQTKWGDQPIFSAGGTFPFQIDFREDSVAQVDFTAPMELEARTEAAEDFWNELANSIGISLRQPSLVVQLEGSLEEPIGLLELTVAEASIQDILEVADVPSIESLKFRIRATPQMVVLEDSGFMVTGQEARINGELPLPAGGVQAFAEADPLGLLKPARVKMTIPKFEIASLGGLRPEAIRPSGSFQLNLRMDPNFDLRGGLEINNVSTFPLPAIGAIRDIGGTIEFDDRIIRIPQFSLSVGGRELGISGTTDLTDFQKPRFDLRAQGERLTLVRQPGIVFRSDMDLALTTNEEGVNRIHGDLGLQDSILLIEMPNLAPSPNEPTQRPPYFIVEEGPLSDWELDIRLSGTEFMNIRNTYLEALVSLDMRLAGTMGDPFLLGDAVVERGVIKFPFARFRIQSGLVRLSESNPYVPSLNLNASVRTVGFTIDMNLSGTSENPALEFTSNPSLDQTDIILLISTGQAPEVFTGRSGQGRLGSLGLYIAAGLRDFFGSGPIDQEESWIDRIDVIYGANFTQDGRSTIEIEIPFTERWSILAEYDEFDAYNLNTRWRIFSR